ncbi:OmpA family protein [Reinekea sp.]|uniref:OmpA family protein n=1 Tax=Reinekea sp. TaxID=1970455 RepID=UPI002A8383A7|nr:OmpA family protein [Reinekea sp.]
MSRLHTTTAIIFSATLLVASLAANLLLFQTNATRGDEFEQAKHTIDRLIQKSSADQNQTLNQSSRLEAIATQQQDMTQIVGELRGHITRLNLEFQQTLETAQQSERLLAQSRIDIKALKGELAGLEQQLAEAQKTINNQHRLLRRSNDTGPRAGKAALQNELLNLSQLLTDQFPDIVLSESAAGEAVIDIPLALIFNPSSLQWVDAINDLMRPLAQALQKLPTAKILIIGHADARPIVSDWAAKYPSNWELSSARASKVVQHLVDLGVTAEQMTAAGKAANNPVRVEANSTAWQINRRLEIRIAN